MTPADIDRSEILQYLRTPVLDEQLSVQLETAIEELCRAAQPRTLWRQLPLTHTDSGVLLGTLPLMGKDIALHLSGCEAAVLLAATLSGSTDRLIRRAERSDMTKALLLDAAAGAAIEHLCNRLEQELKQTLPYPYFTERFSAGYGDFPISQQADLVRLLNAEKRIGLTVTPQSTMVPMKSVTALIGLSHQPVKDARRFCCGSSCAECPYREGCAGSGGKSQSPLI